MRNGSGRGETLANFFVKLAKSEMVCGCCALRRTIKRKVREQRGSCYAEHAEQKDPSSKMRLSARKVPIVLFLSHNRTRTNTNPNGTEANAAGRSGNARALRKQCKCGMIQEGEGHWPNSNSSGNLQKARYLWVLRTPQNNKEEGARAKKLVTCGTRGPVGRGQSVPFSAQGAYCSAPDP